MYDYEANRHLLHSANGNKLTTGLFEEFSRDDTTVTPLFKLSDWRKTYVELADPTGYEAAMQLIGSWEHWLALMESPAFRMHVDRWNQEVEVKLRSEALKQLMKQSRLPTGTAAAKFLAEAGFVERDKRKKKDKEQDDAAGKAAKSKVADDAKRLGLSVVK